MNPRSSLSVYDQVVDISSAYLGSATNRFIARQVENHLHKSPDKLSQADLLGLIDWITMAVSLLTEDSELVEEYASELRRLTIRNNKPLQV